jgi:hypothetical protein
MVQEEVPVATETPAEFEIVPFPRMRHLVIDVLRAAQRKHMIHGLVEADVTRTRQYIREQESSSPLRPLSRPAWAKR